MREGDHQVGRQQQVLGAHHIEEGNLPREQVCAIALDHPVRGLRIEKGLRASPPRQHQARLLEGLAHGRHHEGAIGSGGSTRRELGPRDMRVPGVDLATGEYQRTGCKVDLTMAHDHEYLQPLAPIAQDHHGGRRPRRGDRL